MPIFLQIFSHEYKNEQMVLRSYCTEPHQICTQCSHIQCVSHLPISIWIFQSESSMTAKNDKFAYCQIAYSPQNYLACLANLPTGLHILLVLIAPLFT